MAQVSNQEALLTILSWVDLFDPDMSLTRLRILLALHGAGGTPTLTVKVLSCYLSLSTSNINYNLKKLMEDGWVEIAVNSEPILYQLTRRGRTFCRDIFKPRKYINK
jgi:DNA-binding MarR family transcriptional regulator